MDPVEYLAYVVREMRVCYLEWLVERIGCAARILNVGCEKGSELLALMWRLKAMEGVGLDKDSCVIELAKELMRNIKSTMEDSSLIGWEGWQSEVPEFPRERRFPSFQVADITCPQQLTWMQPGHFDLAYCDTVLCKILEEHGESGVVCALTHMARAVRSGGWIATEEDGAWPGGLCGLERCFRDAGVEVVYSGHKKIGGRVVPNGIALEPLLVLGRVGGAVTGDPDEIRVS
jgi:SAM-dependent methyltransferase